MRLPKTFKRLIIPYYGNNHKAKLRHSNSFVWMSVLSLLLPLLINFVPTSGRVLGYATSISSEGVLQLTNSEREKQGLEPLVMNPLLVNAATAKAKDMFENNYWAHVSPTGVQPWAFFNSAGYVYTYAGENLARDFDENEGVVEAWMKSSSHRENILNAKYNDIGIAVINGVLDGAETTLVVQEFGSQRTSPKIAKVVKENAQPTGKIEKPSITPTMAVVGMAQPQPSIIPDKGNLKSVEKENLQTMKQDLNLVSPLMLVKSWVLAICGLLMLVFIIDMVVLRKIKLPRIGGKTWAHMLVLFFVISAIIFTDSGVIK